MPIKRGNRQAEMAAKRESSNGVRSQRKPAAAESKLATDPNEPVSYIDAISLAMRDALRADDSVYLMGQDVGAFGGAFKVSLGFQNEFGSRRVFNTPIAESGTLGIAAGSALLGLRPVVEMQFADFISCGFNQLTNIIAKTFYRFERPIPLVIRLPAGGGVGAGPFHSQCMEAWFAHVPGLKIVVPATVEDAYVQMREAIADPNPVLFFEHKFLYRREKGVVPQSVRDSVGDRVDAKARVVREGSDLSIISYGWMLHRSLEAAEQLASEGISAEVIDLRTLVPLDEDTLVESVEKTHRALIVHEATRTSGFGAEVAAVLSEKAIGYLDAPIYRVTYPDCPSPFKKTLEAANLPDPDKIVAQARLTLQY